MVTHISPFILAACASSERRAAIEITESLNGTQSAFHADDMFITTENEKFEAWKVRS